MGLLTGNNVNVVDRSVHNHGPSRIDVPEHRAPTDDSIRLAQEMEEKITSKVVWRGHNSPDNHFNFTAQIVEVAMFDPSVGTGSRYALFITFVLNGKKFGIRHDFKPQENEYVLAVHSDPNIDGRPVPKFDQDGIMRICFSEIALKVMQEMMNAEPKVFKECMNAIRESNLSVFARLR